MSLAVIVAKEIVIMSMGVDSLSYTIVKMSAYNKYIN